MAGAVREHLAAATRGPPASICDRDFAASQTWPDLPRGKGSFAAHTLMFQGQYAFEHCPFIITVRLQ